MDFTDRNGQPITPEQATMFIDDLTPDMVLSVYSGRSGCMCGCLGTHKYNPLYPQEAAKARGYEIDPEEFSSRSIALILNKIKKSAKTEIQDGYILHFRDEERKRQYAVYLKKCNAYIVSMSENSSTNVV